VNLEIRLGQPGKRLAGPPIPFLVVEGADDVALPQRLLELLEDGVRPIAHTPQ
jgi:hypothetical protein